MAAGLPSQLAGDRVEVRSAGSEPADQINPAAIAGMAEIGIDITAQPRRSSPPTPSATSDVVITMGCGDTCPYLPRQCLRDWELDRPRRPTARGVRAIRDDIAQRVEALLAELLPTTTP